MANNPEDFVPLAPNAEFPEEQFEHSVIESEPKSVVNSSLINLTHGVLTFNFASFSETIVPWGTNVVRRDRQLRDFWKTEDMLAGAVYSVCARNSAFEWEIEAPPKTKVAITNMLHNAIAGPQTYGWIPFITAFSLDLYTQDNGAFIELIRRKNNEDSPVVGIAHLDSGQCQRTGNPEIPVIYTDKDGENHKLKWWNVIATSEFPSPEERMYGVGFCAVSRVLRLADILKNIAVFKNEKVSGRFYKQIHFVGGVSKQEINDIMSRGQEDADNSGQTRYILPEIIASLDPEKPVSTASIDLAALPDNFDLDTELKWYITGLALGFGVDYQDFAPLPGGNLGTSMQSETLHRKSRGKSPKLFMETIQNIFHYYGVLPRNAQFKFLDKDLALDLEEQKLLSERATARAVRIRSGEIPPQTARDIALRQGDLTKKEHSDVPAKFGEDFMKPDRQLTNSGGDTIGNSQADNIKKMAEGKGAEIEEAFINAAHRQNQNEVNHDMFKALKEEKQRSIIVNVPKPEEKEIIVNLPEIKPEITVNIEKQDFPEIPEPNMQVNVRMPDEKEEEIIEILERDSAGRVLKARKTKK